MDDQWYCLLGDEVFGPWTFEELTQFAEGRQLKSTDEVKLGENGKWRRVGTIGRLMAVLPYEEVETNIIAAAAASRPARKEPVADDGGTDESSGQTQDLRNLANRPRPADQTRAKDSAVGSGSKDREKVSLFDASYETPTPTTAPKRKQLLSADKAEQPGKILPAQDQNRSQGGEVVKHVTVAPTQAAFNIAYEQAKAKITQSMLVQAENAFRSTEEVAKTHVAWATGPTVDRFWYGWASGIEFGPVEFNQVFGLAKSGQLKPTDFVRNGQHSQFAPAGNVPGLFTAVAMINKAIETLNIAKSQAIAVASFAGQAPAAPVEVTGAVPKPLTKPEKPPASVASPPPKKRSETVISKVTNKSNHSTSTLPAPAECSSADVPIFSTVRNDSKRPSQPKPSQKSSTQQRPVSNADMRAASRTPSNADISTKSRSASTTELSTKEELPAVASGNSTSMPIESANADAGEQSIPVSIELNQKLTGLKSNRSVWLSDSWLNNQLQPLRDPKTVGTLCAVALIGLTIAGQYLPKSRTADINHFKALMHSLEEIRTVRTTNPAELSKLKKKLEILGNEVVADLKVKANRYEPAKQFLLWATRDELPRYLTSGLQIADSQSERGFERLLREASYELGLEKRPPPDLKLQVANVVADE